MLSYTVSQRTREFGLRMALGAAPGRVRQHVLRQVLWMVGIGAVVGLGLALGAGQFLAALLFQTEAYDGWIVSIRGCRDVPHRPGRRHDARDTRVANRSDESVDGMNSSRHCGFAICD